MSVTGRGQTSTRTSLLVLISTLVLLLSAMALVRPLLPTVAAQGEGEADCPEGTVFIDNFDQADLVVGLILTDGVVVTAVTRENGGNGQATSVTIANNSGSAVTIAVKGGSNQVGNSVTIQPGGVATIQVSGNPTISNLSVCEGPTSTPTPTPEVTPTPTPEVTPTPTPEVTPTPTPTESEAPSTSTPTPTPEVTPTPTESEAAATSTPTATERGGVAGGNPTPAGGLPNTATDGPATSVPAALFGLLALLSLGALLSVRLVKAPTRR